jgi:hypothetical protein
MANAGHQLITSFFSKVKKKDIIWNMSLHRGAVLTKEIFFFTRRRFGASRDISAGLRKGAAFE